MMIMKIIKTIIPLVLFILLGMSCKKNALDIPPPDQFGEESVWSDPKLIEAYHNELYSSMIHGFQINSNYDKYTDEVYNSLACCGGRPF